MAYTQHYQLGEILMHGSSLATPLARQLNLVVTEAADEVIAYDLLGHHIHHLNTTSAAVWRLCDGQRSIQGIAVAAGLPVDLVQIALGKLAAADLLSNPEPWAAVNTHSRRSFMKKAAAAGIAVPVIASVTAPQAAANHSQGQCTPHGTIIPGATGTNSPGCEHCCKPEGSTRARYCYYAVGAYRCYGQ